MLLFLKLVVVPLLVASVSLGARRWGSQVGGVLAATPVSVGPILGFYAIERGNTFAVMAAQAALIGLIAVAAFAVAYGRTALRATWPFSLLAGGMAYTAAAAVLGRVDVSAETSLGFAVALLWVARRGLPDIQVAAHPTQLEDQSCSSDIPWRIAAAAGLVIVLTSVADRLGATWSGFLAPFPVVSGVIVTFTHARVGSTAVLLYLLGLLPALNSLALFCFAIAVLVPHVGMASGMALALSAQFSAQILQLWLMKRRGPKPVR
jgi:hypothetical protein